MKTLVWLVCLMLTGSVAAGAQYGAGGPVMPAEQTGDRTSPQNPGEPANPVLKPNPMQTLRNFEPAADEEYRLGRGDEITVDFAGRAEMQAKLAVGPDGRITLPLAGDLTVAGKTRTEAAQAVVTALEPYYANLSAQVTVTKYVSNRVVVLGDVERPGPVSFEGTPTLLEALTRAGLTAAGPGKTAEVPERCAIYRGENQVVWVELKKLVESGNAMADLRLRRDDVVYVPNMRERFVSVLGQVAHPGAVPLSDASTLASVLATAGGTTAAAGTMPHIQIVDPATGTARTVSMKDVLNPVKTSEIALKPGEIVFVYPSGLYRATYVLERLAPLFQLSTLAYLKGLN
jgi:polysaccharide export outer membrane protein